MLVALSGGADSTLLLHLLHGASCSLGFPLYAAHVNHNIRTEKYADEATRDESFCRNLCEKLGIKLFVLNVDVPSLAKQSGKSLETAARDVRYDFFAETMRQNDIKILATAHNADDNLETQIFNLARGCGIDGICGIPEVREFSAVRGGIIVRPILAAAKAEVIEYCQSNGFDYVTDSTNNKDDCTRNRIRHNIIPELVDLFGTPQKAATRLSRLASTDADYLDKTACEYLDRSGGIIDLSDFNSLHPSISSRVISAAYFAYAGTTLERTHIESVLKLAKASVAHSSISLPHKVAAKIEQNRLVFVKDEKMPIPESYNQPLNAGLNIVANGNFAVFIGENPPEQSFEADKEIFSYFSSARISVDALDGIFASNRREGDLIRDGKMSKKVKKLLCDKKIPVGIRDLLPMISDGDEIIYIPACAVADKARAKGKKTATLITIYQKKSEDI